VLKHPPPLLHLLQGAEGALRTPLTHHHLTQQLSHPQLLRSLLVDIKLPTYGTVHGWNSSLQFVVSRLLCSTRGVRTDVLICPPTCDWRDGWQGSTPTPASDSSQQRRWIGLMAGLLRVLRSAKDQKDGSYAVQSLDLSWRSALDAGPFENEIRSGGCFLRDWDSFVWSRRWRLDLGALWSKRKKIKNLYMNKVR
jgi:hypothetical protein